MAITIASTDWESMIGSKTCSPQSLVSSARKMLMYIATVTFGSGDNYATNGVAVNLKKRGAKTIKYAIPIENTANCFMRYNVATGKLMLYGYINDDAAGTNTTPEALTELANASTITQSKTFTFLVFAQS